MAIRLTINGQIQELDLEDDMPLLWALRDELGLVGTRYGCGVAQCGACTVHVDGEAVRSCQQRVGDLRGAQITTIEGLGPANTKHAIQEAWIEQQVAQCGYCQSGQMMQAAALLSENPNPTDEEIDDAMSGNLCRCGTYPKIQAAIRSASERLRSI